MEVSKEMNQSCSVLAAHSSRKRDLQRCMLSIVLIAVFACQAAVLCYFNFTQLRNHMGFDSSWNFVRSAFMWHEKAMVSPSWSETSSLHLDTHNILVSLLYGCTGNIMLAYGLANTLIVTTILFVLWKILDRMNVCFNAKIIALNLVICPWLTNGFFIYLDLGYFSMILSGASQYSLRVLVVLLIVDEFLIIRQKGQMGPLAWVIWLFLFLCGFSSGFYMIVVILAPCLVWAGEMFFIHNDWKQLLRKECVFFYICCAFVAAGKCTAGLMIDFIALDNSRTWTSLENLWLNFGSVVQGFMLLLQVLPISGYADTIVSKTGFLRMGALAAFVLIIFSMISVIIRTWKDWKEKDGALLLLVDIVALHFLVFGLYNANYGVDIFEERYLIVAFFAAVIMTALFFEKLEAKRAVSLALSLVMAVSIALVDVHSDYNYLKTTNEEWRIDELQSIAESHDAGVVYFWGSDLRAIGRTMRACDLDRVYKNIEDSGGFFHGNGDYLYYDDFKEYTGPTLMICSRTEQSVPKSVLAEYTFLDTLDYTLLGNTDHLDIYISDHNPKLW